MIPDHDNNYEDRYNSDSGRQPYRRRFDYGRFDDRSLDQAELSKPSGGHGSYDGYDTFDQDADAFGDDFASGDFVDYLEDESNRDRRGHGNDRRRDYDDDSRRGYNEDGSRYDEDNRRGFDDDRRGYDGDNRRDTLGEYDSPREQGYENREKSDFLRQSLHAGHSGRDRRDMPGRERDFDEERVRPRGPSGTRPRDSHMGPRSDMRRGSRHSRERRRRSVMIALTVLLFALAAGAGLLVYLMSDRVTSPMEVSTALTQMDGGVIKRLLTAQVNDRLSSRSVQINAGGSSYTLSLGGCEFCLSDEPDGTSHRVSELVESGETDQYVRRTYMTRGAVSFNATALLDALHAAAQGTSDANVVRPTEPDYYADIRQDMNTKEYYGTLYIKSGKDGYGIDLDAFMNELLTRIYNDDYPPINISLSAARAPALTIDAVYADIHAEPVDASAKNDGSGNITYVPEVVGVDFDKAAAAQKIAEGGDCSVALSITMPRVTRKALMAETFPDLLATYSTTFAASNVARSSNLAHAGEFINGTILQPGDVFSFNGTVGERTKARGFQKATVYSAEGTDEDYGGGICQTSSTLFYCAMKANLEVVERRSHRYTVSYMVDEEGNTCFGNDATVNWGIADMKFRNSKEFPIKIECVTKSGTITFNIWGTWDGYTAEYTYKTRDIVDYQIVYRIPEPDKKDHVGQKGRTVTTYRHIYYQAEKDVGQREEISEQKEFESRYFPMPQTKYVDAPPEGFEFNVLYDQGYQPPTTTAPTSAATQPAEPTQPAEQPPAEP